MHRIKTAMILLGLLLMISLGWVSSVGAVPPPMPPVKLIQSFEDLLGRQEGLLHSFEWLVGQFKVPPRELLKSYEDLLHRQAKLLLSFEELTKPFVCTPGIHPPLELIVSFEKLLHGQERLLKSFEDLLERHAVPPTELLVSFEDLLKSQADLIHSFEELLHCLVKVHHLPPRALFKFLVSFEDLLRSQAELLRSFEDLVKKDPAPASADNPPFARPHEGQELPSLQEIRSVALRGAQMPRDRLQEMLQSFVTRLERFRQETQKLRVQGRFEEAAQREAELARLRQGLTQLQNELLRQFLIVQMAPVTDARGVFEITVENRGPWTVTMASVIVLDGPRMIHSQSLEMLQPEAVRRVTLKLAPTATHVRAVATGFLESITRLLRATMDL